MATSISVNFSNIGAQCIVPTINPTT